MKIYGNDFINVTLRKPGADYLNAKNKYSNARFNLKLKTDYKPGDVYKQALWFIMQDFGHLCVAGCETPFDYMERT